MAPEPEDDIMNEKNPRPLDEDDIALLKTYVRASTPRLDLSNLVDLGFFGDLDLGAGLRICVRCGSGSRSV
jgi:hypothetical protein